MNMRVVETAFDQRFESNGSRWRSGSILSNSRVPFHVIEKEVERELKSAAMTAVSVVVELSTGVTTAEPLLLKVR
ncbi:hypothetical protein Y032_0069g296 [Ancylostoma ceylanicum]|uniref:Uncharacterized protein n=2 Tax=Ancylostoma ceylanicum TaxID=53326 RepID=A0A016TYC2_9BILA|nr:hypothetical protein Y032_0069g296 [Ancylostoma ceylanicum]